MIRTHTRDCARSPSTECTCGAKPTVGARSVEQTVELVVEIRDKVVFELCKMATDQPECCSTQLEQAAEVISLMLHDVAKKMRDPQ